MKLHDKAAREVGFYASYFPLAREFFRLGARVAGVVTGERKFVIRNQINVLRALSDVWHNLHRYEQAYPSPVLPSRIVDTKALLDAYDCFFIDIFGTCKDENGVWPEAGGVLRTLKRMGKHIVVISNSADFSPEETIKQLKTVGVHLNLDQIVMAGQMLRDVLFELGLRGAKVLCIGNEATQEYVRAAGAEPVTKISGSYQAILVSFLGSPLPPEDQARLERMVSKREIPIIQANMDMFLPCESGLVENKSFRLAKDLAKKGSNRIVEVGKPQPAIYEEAFRRLTTKQPGKILCIGDTLWTDIQGASRFQAAHPELHVDSLLVFSGTERKVHHSPAILEAYMNDFGIFPTYILPRLEIAD